MAKLYGKNQLKKLIDGHNAVIEAKKKVDDQVHAMAIAARQREKYYPLYGGEVLTHVKLIEKVIGKDRDYITDVIATEWMNRFIPVPQLMYTPWTRDGFFSNMYGKNEPTKHQKNFELLLLEWSFLEEDPVRP